MNFWQVALERSVLLRGFRVAVVVGSILIAVNHWDVLLYGPVTGINIFQMMLTPLVPFCVSVYSSVKAIMKQQSAESCGESGREVGRV